MQIKLDPELEKILAAVYKGQRESRDQTFHVTGPDQLRSLGIDPDSRIRHQQFKFLDEQGFLIDATEGSNVTFYDVQLTRQGEMYCEQHQLV